VNLVSITFFPLKFSNLELSGSSRDSLQTIFRNPASPDVLISPPPWENLQSAASPQGHPGLSPMIQSPLSPPHSRTSVPTSPTRTRSMSDLLSEHEKSKNQGRQQGLEQSGSRSTLHFDREGAIDGDEESREERKTQSEKDSSVPL
jgi:hypothetical protein